MIWIVFGLVALWIIGAAVKGYRESSLMRDSHKLVRRELRKGEKA